MCEIGHTGRLGNTGVMRIATALLAFLSLSSVVQAAERIQAPDAPWRTYRTAHYRIHFPARGDFEPFAREVAGKIEGIHDQVVAWVGYASPVPVEVVIRDPVLEANGYAFPLLEHPFVVLWKTPPEAESGIAHVTTWAELLVTHELTHVHHLMRPQNQPNWRDKLLDLPVSPLALKAPRWVTEGYATLIEGKITGKGRPHGAYRAAVIRQWALEGKLPDYGALSAMGGFRGGSMAYLVGSAYLEWLEARNPQDPDLLKKFWKQLVSKKRRPFAASFEATFGLNARDGYDRWRAEVVHDALELERRMKGQLREGELWAKVDGEDRPGREPRWQAPAGPGADRKIQQPDGVGSLGQGRPREGGEKEEARGYETRSQRSGGPAAGDSCPRTRVETGESPGRAAPPGHMER